jgi:hypothetical protein
MFLNDQSNARSHTVCPESTDYLGIYCSSLRQRKKVTCIVPPPPFGSNVRDSLLVEGGFQDTVWEDPPPRPSIANQSLVMPFRRVFLVVFCQTSAQTNSKLQATWNAQATYWHEQYSTASFYTCQLESRTYNVQKRKYCFTVNSTSTKWFKYDRDYLCVNKSQFVPVISEPPCIWGVLYTTDFHIAFGSFAACRHTFYVHQKHSSTACWHATFQPQWQLVPRVQPKWRA